LVLLSSFFSGAAGADASPAGAAGAGSDGAGAGAAAGGGGGGGGGAGSSFLPHPANASVKANRNVPDSKAIFLSIINSPPFPSHTSMDFAQQFLLHKSGLYARVFPGNSVVVPEP
jgi:hypothetical protein